MLRVLRTAPHAAARAAAAALVLAAARVGAQPTTVAPSEATVVSVTEERREGRMFGEERLLELLRQSAGLSAAGIADRIERAVLEFKPGPPADDVAVIVVRLTGNE